MATNRNEWNQKIIDEFRANQGRVGGPFEGTTLLLLHHRGAKSGAERVNPLAYQKLDNGFAIFASKGGAPDNPDWYHNLVANPDVTIEVGTETVPVHARIARGEERERIWDQQKHMSPGFADYEKKTPREIPEIVLEPAR